VCVCACVCVCSHVHFAYKEGGGADSIKIGLNCQMDACGCVLMYISHTTSNVIIHHVVADYFLRIYRTLLQSNRALLSRSMCVDCIHTREGIDSDA